MMNTNVYKTFHAIMMDKWWSQLGGGCISIDENQEYSFQLHHKRISKQIFFVIDIQEIKSRNYHLNLEERFSFVNIFWKDVGPFRIEFGYSDFFLYMLNYTEFLI